MPKIVVTDKARQFVGNEFTNFAHDWNFKHVTSSPYHQQANGKAESAVKIVKNTIIKSNMSNKYAKRQWQLSSPAIDYTTNT
jgi:transposase InsO family protein